jgi:tubby-related protein 1
MFYLGDDDDKQNTLPKSPSRNVGTPTRPQTGGGGGVNYYTSTQVQSMSDNLDDLDDMALPGSMASNENDIIQQKFQRLKMDAQRNTPNSRGNMGLIGSSGKVPLSARGTSSSARPNSAANRGNGWGGASPVTGYNQYDRNEQSALQTGVEMLDDLDTIPVPDSHRQPSNIDPEYLSKGITPATRSDMDISSPRSVSSPTSPTPRRDLVISDRKTFVLQSAPKDQGFIKCTITRDKTGMNKLFPRYYLWTDGGGQSPGMFLLSAKKRKKNKSSNYTISLSQDEQSKDSGSFVGKLRSNFVGTEFYIFDNGDSKKSIDPNAKGRRQLGGIFYETNILGAKGPRKLTVAVPDVDNEGNYCQFPQSEEKPVLTEKYKNSDWHNLRIFKNKSPVWNEKLKAYVLNFNGRVTKASVKNFQLAEPENPNKVFLQFGKVDSNKFNLDYRMPLSAIQAFCIAISAFDSKLACE